MSSPNTPRGGLIGLVATVTTSFSLPYQVARQLQVLDQISGGRAGWNAVTSFAGEAQFGLPDLPDQTSRYARAAEYAAIVQGLTSGWAADAITADEGRITIHPERITEIAVQGQQLSSQGALGVPRSPQGRPVLFQAGGSPLGVDFAGQFAEAVFSASPDIDHAIAKRAELREAAQRHRGETGLPLVFPGFGPHIAATRGQALEKQRARLETLDIEAGRTSLAVNFGHIQLEDLELDAPIPRERLPDTSQLQRRQSRPALFRSLAEKGATLWDIIVAHLTNNGHYQFTGSYDEAAEELIRWHQAGAADGFVLVFLDGTAGARDFVEHVVPRLVDRGAFRSAYESDTLRGHLGLPVPA